MKNKSTLTIIRGNPGSGKSTFAKNMFDHHCHLEADQYFVDIDGNYHFDQKLIGAAHQWCQTSTKNLLNQGCSVVVTNTFTTIKELRPYFEIALEFQILPEIIHLQNDYGNIHNVPDDVIIKMRNRFQYDISELINSYKIRLENEFTTLETL